ALAEFIVELNADHGPYPGITINVAEVTGGGPLNVVPDFALCRFNVRTGDSQDEAVVESNLASLIKKGNRRDGISVNLHPMSRRPPKTLDQRTRSLMDHVSRCGLELGMTLEWKAGGGASDGNILASKGLPVVDSLGVRGANIHSEEEFMHLDSLVERAKLTAAVLMEAAHIHRSLQ
ncbi:MAG: M20/M25/M40 family metallo-hydrolase, partial [Pseudomonadota bacterium]